MGSSCRKCGRRVLHGQGLGAWRGLPRWVHARWALVWEMGSPAGIQLQHGRQW